MHASFPCGLALLLGLSAASLSSAARSDTLALPQNLVDARSPQGGALLADGEARDTYLQIVNVFETQKNQAYCGIASLVMVLNAVKVPAPTSAEYQPFAMFTQSNVLDDATDAILPRTVIDQQGTTLDQLGQLLARHPIAVGVRHAEAGGLDEFRKQASEHLKAKDRFVIVNYLRKSLGQESGGHISPLAAYDAETDRFLILDVARYKYPPVWVTASDLFGAMNTPDTVSGKNRGYVLISKTDHSKP